MQRYIDYKKLKRLMKDISGFNASQRMEGEQPMTHIQPKQVQQQHTLTTGGCIQAEPYRFVLDPAYSALHDKQ